MEQPEEKMQSGWSTFRTGAVEFFSKLIDLRKEVDKEGTIINIRNNNKMMGSNAWMLMCSIVIASIGLDQNSQAVIIGAMLISPLMSPILGIGLAVGINDRMMLNVSIRHFAIAIAIALITSFLYFALTPFGTMTEQIEARTAPTFLDVLIAFFGGIAGIVSGSRKDISNAIPGVAIATALMPPLCVTGFGLAMGDWTAALNSFYLFFLNSVFVALATYLIVRWLNFPIKDFVNENEQRKAQVGVTIFAILMIIPSLYILNNVLADVRTQQSINQFVSTNFNVDALTRIDKIKNTDTLAVRVFLFEEMSDDSVQMFQDRFAALQDCKARLRIIQQPNIEKEQFEQLQNAKSQEQELLGLIDGNRKTINQQQTTILQLRSTIDSLEDTQVQFAEMSKELKILFPNLKEISFANAQTTNFDTLLQGIPTLLIEWDNKIGARSKRNQETKMMNFVLERINLDTLKISR